MGKGRDWETLSDDEVERSKEWSKIKPKVEVQSQPAGVLEDYFGYKEFRGGQEDVINRMLSGEDVFLVMPTGGGKSLCFQIPALCIRGTAIVISPLIALMKDQVDSLVKNGVRATFINSTLTDKEVKTRIDSMIKGEYELVYVAPERVSSAYFMDALSYTDISLFAIDEAHCISKWGHDFRPAYRRIPRIFSKSSKRVPVIAVTATATPRVRRDIVEHLGMANPHVKVTGFRRPNLNLEIRFANDAVDDVVYWARDIKKKLGGEEFPSTIIYVGTKKNTERVAVALRRYGISCDYYNGGMDSKTRNAVQNRFMGGETNIVVATNAFGMGVDKADIRYVCHATLPGSIEAYYQEVGRAGRDGKGSTCIMFFDAEGIRLQEYFISSSHPSSQVAQRVYFVLMKLFERNGSPLKITYREVAEYCQRTGRFDEREVGQTLTMLKKRGVFSSPKRGIMVLIPDHEEVDFDTFDRYRKEAETRLKGMISFTKEKDLQEAVLTYFDAEG